MLAPVLTRTSIYLFSMSQRIIFHCPVVLSEPVRPMKIVKPFWRVISVQILATSPSFFPWNPVCAISSRSRETLFLPTSIVLTGLERTSLFRTTLSHLECLLNYFVNLLSGFLPEAKKMLTVASSSPFEDLVQQSSPRDSTATFVIPAARHQLDTDPLSKPFQRSWCSVLRNSNSWLSRSVTTTTPPGLRTLAISRTALEGSST